MNFRPNKYFKYYLQWIVERQNIFYRRLNGERPPYTDDPILQNYKFTNVYRILDRETQYLLRNVIYNRRWNNKSLFWRILIYKHFNSHRTWEELTKRIGQINQYTELKEIVKACDDMRNNGMKLYNNAYMLTASFMRNERILNTLGIKPGTSKHDTYFTIFQRQIRDTHLDDEIINSTDFESAFNKISTVTAVGGFLAYQYVQDWNYSPMFTHNVEWFCYAGPGTMRGIQRTFHLRDKPDYGNIVIWTHRNFHQLLMDYGLYNDFEPLPGWWPQVPDLSNCFCEVDKYLRAMGTGQNIHGKRIKNKFKPSPQSIQYMFPPKWGIKL